MIKLIKEKGFTELIVLDNCEFEFFFRFAEKFEKELSINYYEKIDDFDELYWMLQYEKSNFVLSYSTFSGISIYPKAGKEATDQDNINLNKLKEIIIKFISSLDKKGTN